MNKLLRIHLKGGDPIEVHGTVKFENGWLIVQAKAEPGRTVAYSDEQVLKVEINPE